MTFDDLVRHIFKKRDSTFIAILGRKESGKTDLALRILESCYQQKLFKYFGTNIEGLSNTPCEIDTIVDLPTLLERCQTLGKPYLFILDELGDTAPKDQPWLNVDLIKSLQKVRKYKLSLIGCAIDRVDSRVLNPTHFYGYFEKFSPDRKDVAMYTDWLKRKRTKVLGITPTQITFDTYQPASFHMNRTSSSSLNTDRDISNHHIWCNGGSHADYVKEGGVLGKTSWYDSCRHGGRKLEELAQSSSSEGLAR